MKEGKKMAKYREIPCKFYIAKGICEKNRKAELRGYCQRCMKYVPRAKVKYKNKKIDKLSQLKRKIDV